MAGADIPDAQLTDCLAALRGGATLLLLSDGSTGAPLLERLGIQIAPVGAEGVAVVEPLLLRPPVAQVDATAASEISAAPPGAVALSGASGAVLERFAVGRGALWVDTAPAMFSNASLSSADNARAMANLLPPHAHVWFEEYVGGSTAIASAKANWLSDSVWGVAAIFAFFVLLAYRGLTGVRLGPPSTPLRETRRPATEFVTSMAGTLRDARAGDDLLRFYRRRLERAVRERNIDAHPSDAARELSAEVHAVLDGAAPVSESELLARVRAIADYQDRLEKTSV
jgi:hypothetical protein